MTRGTTPTLTFELPFDADRLTLLSVAFEQSGQVVLEKTLSDCTIDGQTVQLPLSENDTLSLKQDGSLLYIQLRCGIGTQRIASDIITTTVGRILREGALDNELSGEV